MYTEYLFLPLLVAVSGVTGFLINNAFTTIHAPAGEMLGSTEMVNVNGRQKQVHKFTGIPYAEAPMGYLRFRKPVPKPRFSTPFLATKQGQSCYPSSSTNIYNETYSEDCLILNVITPDPAHNAKYPVMIWIHGGGFIFGSSDRYDARGLSAFGDVILVTVNYRLSGLGFLSTGDYNAPGNFGLWDQQLAIQWVNKNIAAFGGDTSKVTIFGESAGSASVMFQSIYPGNKGLFQRVIAQSGSVTGSWPISEKDEMTNFSHKLAEYTGCNQVTATDYVQCLRLTSSDTLNEAIMFAARHGVQLWTPVLDHEFVLDHPDKILDGSTTSAAALDMFRSVDLMIGANSADGLLFFSETMHQLNITDYNDLHVSKDFFENVEIPRILHKFYHSDNYSRGMAKAATIFEYTNWADPENEQERLKSIYSMQSDYTMFVPAAQAASSHTHSSRSTYVYLFATHPTYHIIPVPPQLDGPGVMNHFDDVPFVFGYERMMNHRGVNYVRNSDMRKVSNMVMTMWTNFAKTGSPNQPIDILSYTNTPWPEYNATTEEFLELTPNMTAASVRQHYVSRAVEFWENLLPSLV